jgi:hypothetical protein
MAGILDKIKGMFGGAKSDADGTTKVASSMDSLKDKAGDVKDKVDDLVHKAGEKVPDKVKETYEKVSDKVEGIIPGDKGNDNDDKVSDGE